MKLHLPLLVMYVHFECDLFGPLGLNSSLASSVVARINCDIFELNCLCFLCRVEHVLVCGNAFLVLDRHFFLGIFIRGVFRIEQHFGLPMFLHFHLFTTAYDGIVLSRTIALLHV